MTAHPVPSHMPTYERRAWEELERWRAERLTERTRRQLPPGVRSRVSNWGHRAKGGVESLPGVPDFESVFAKALEGLFSLSLRTASATVPRQAIIDAYRKQGHPVDDLIDIHKIDLAVIDKVKPRLGLRYIAAGTIEGAGAGFVISGGELLASTGTVFGAGAGGAPGAATVIGAMAADAAAVLLAAQRAIGHIAAYYGFDTDKPHEQVFMLGVLGMGTATEAGKVAAYAEINQLVQALARRATWEKLNKSVISKATQRVFARLGFRLTQRKLGQVVPVIGIALGAGMNAQMLQRVTDDAEHLYRERWLREKFDVSVDPPSESSYDATDTLDIADIIDAEIVEEESQLSVSTASLHRVTSGDGVQEFYALLEQGSKELHEDHPDLMSSSELIPTPNVIDHSDVELFFRGLELGLITLQRGVRFNTLDRPSPSGRWGLLSRSAEGGWYNSEYLPQIAAYVEAIDTLGYPSERVFFELPGSALQLDLAILDDQGRVVVLGEAKRDNDAVDVLRTGVLKRFAEAAPGPDTRKRGDEQRQLAWRLWTVQAPLTWLIGPGRRVAYETSVAPLRLSSLPQLPSAGDLGLDHSPPIPLTPPQLA